MANQTPVATKTVPTSLADVREAILSGAFTMEDLMSTLTSGAIYARAGGAYRELIKDGLSNIRGQFIVCYKLGKKINNDGSEAPTRPRKKKTS